MSNFGNNIQQPTTFDEAVKFLRKQVPGQFITLLNLPPHTIKRMDRYCVVRGLDEFGYNLLNYTEGRQVLKITSVSGTRTHVITTFNIQLPFKAETESTKVTYTGKVKDSFTFAIAREYCYELNFYVVRVTQRMPKFHLGCMRVLCGEGTVLYVSIVPASKIQDEILTVPTSTLQRIYAFDYKQSEIKKHISIVYSMLCATVKAVCSDWVIPTMDMPSYRHMITEKQEMLTTDVE